MIASSRTKGFEVGRLACRLAIAMMLAGAAAGCNDRPTVTRLSPKNNSYLEGIPVPAKFQLAEKMTEDYESGGERTARHEYRGFSDPPSIREFYREQMPTLGWVRVSDQNVKGRITLRFERKSEACTIEIEPGYLFQTTIRVIVNPFTRSPMESPRRQVP